MKRCRCFQNISVGRGYQFLSVYSNISGTWNILCLTIYLSIRTYLYSSLQWFVSVLVRSRNSCMCCMFFKNLRKSNDSSRSMDIRSSSIFLPKLLSESIRVTAIYLFGEKGRYCYCWSQWFRGLFYGLLSSLELFSLFFQDLFVSLFFTSLVQLLALSVGWTHLLVFLFF